MRLLILLLTLAVSGSCLAHPGAGIAVAADGRIYFVDTRGAVYSLERDGKIVRREGPAYHWFAYDAAGRFHGTGLPAIPGGQLRSAGPLVLSSDVPVTIGTDGKLYYPEAAGSRVRIVAVDRAGVISVRALLPPMQSEGRAAQWVNGLAAGPDGSLFYTEDAAVRKIDAQGRVSVIGARVTVPNCTATPGVGPELRPYLRGLAVAADGTVYVAASGCGALVKIDPRGRATTLLRTAAPWSPTAVAESAGEVYVLEYLHTASDDRTQWVPRVRKIARDGSVSTLTPAAGVPRAR
jgi:outer membrane protein assembly factor BamB